MRFSARPRGGRHRCDGLRQGLELNVRNFVILSVGILGRSEIVCVVLKLKSITAAATYAAALWSVQAHATTYYVNAVTGDDAK
jgi:hypothetical protein